MSAPRRVQQQPAFILHHRPFRDSSQILDILTRDHGKIALVARGSRGAKSRLRGVLRPFLPLRISWVARSDLGTLTGAEAAGLPAGDVEITFDNTVNPPVYTIAVVWEEPGQPQNYTVTIPVPGF